jgi:hypothetical protein
VGKISYTAVRNPPVGDKQQTQPNRQPRDQPGGSVDRSIFVKLPRWRPGRGRLSSGQRSHADHLNVRDMALAPRRQVFIVKTSVEAEPC